MKDKRLKIKDKKLKIKNYGFTLIELLIVIAILGVLAVGLLATIDPFEQLKKGRDTSTRNMVEEFYNAALRYYAIKNSFPWGTDPQSAVALTNAVMASALTAIQSAGELKEAFLDSTGLNKILVTSDTGEDLTVCFQPQSKAFRNDNNTKYDSNGDTYSGAGTCPRSDGSDCYWCIR